jgi:hypothetical protein
MSCFKTLRANGEVRIFLAILTVCVAGSPSRAALHPSVHPSCPCCSYFGDLSGASSMDVLRRIFQLEAEELIQV